MKELNVQAIIVGQEKVGIIKRISSGRQLLININILRENIYWRIFLRISINL